MLSKDAILNFDDQQTEIIPIPEQGDEVTIAVMSCLARDRFEASLIGTNVETNMQNIRSKLVAASMVDEDGELMFSNADILKLGKKSSVALDRIFSAAQSLNKITDAEVDELAKN